MYERLYRYPYDNWTAGALIWSVPTRPKTTSVFIYLCVTIKRTDTLIHGASGIAHITYIIYTPIQLRQYIGFLNT